MMQDLAQWRFVKCAFSWTTVPLTVTGFARATSPPPFGRGKENRCADKKAPADALSGRNASAMTREEYFSGASL
jgi:hypothetical protein